MKERKAFNLSARRTATLHWKLSKSSLRALRRAKKVSVRLTIVTFDVAYNRTTVRKMVVLRAP